jgi:hypothetical protein
MQHYASCPGAKEELREEEEKKGALSLYIIIGVWC